MFGIADFGAFCAAILLFLALPGPGTFALLTATGQGGRRGGAAATLGVILGDQVLLWLAVAGVAALLDEAWYVDTPDTLRVPRLVARHVAHGRTEAEARRWVGASDEPNARRVAGTRGRAAYVFRWAG